MATASLDTHAAEGKDPGAVDNRLSLDPNDPRWKNKLADWEDGERYPLSIGGIKVEIEQLSPGEFEVVGGDDEDVEEGDDEGEEDAEEAAPTPPKKYGKMNKAVRGMMDEG